MVGELIADLADTDARLYRLCNDYVVADYTAYNAYDNGSKFIKTGKLR